MNITHGGKQYQVTVVDDGTLDTVISVDGTPHRFDAAHVQRYRDEHGFLSELGIQELTIECIDYTEKG